jgi:hypothetical protein
LKMAGLTKVSIWGKNWRRGRNSGTRVRPGLYTAQGRASSRRRSLRSRQRRRKAGHGVSLSTMREERDEDDLPPIFF